MNGVKHINIAAIVIIVMAGWGLILGSCFATFIFIMTTDATSSLNINSLVVAVFSTLLLLSTMVILPRYAIKQLKSGGQLWPAYLFSGLCAIGTFPVGTILCVYVLFVLIKYGKSST